MITKAMRSPLLSVKVSARGLDDEDSPGPNVRVHLEGQALLDLL